MKSIDWNNKNMMAAIKNINLRPAIGPNEEAGKRCAILGTIIEFQGEKLDGSHEANKVVRAYAKGRLSSDEAYKQLHKIGALSDA